MAGVAAQLIDFESKAIQKRFKSDSKKNVELGTLFLGFSLGIKIHRCHQSLVYNLLLPFSCEARVTFVRTYQ